MSGRQIMTADEIRRATIRISHEIVEKQAGTTGLALVGIQRRGVPLARRIADAIAEHEGVSVPVGALDITFYRDDLSLVAQQTRTLGCSRTLPTSTARWVSSRTRAAIGSPVPHGCSATTANSSPP